MAAASRVGGPEPTPVQGLRRFVPIVGWLPSYQRSWWRLDVVAGLTVTAILIPEGMAYAQLAGVGPEVAFYAAPIGLLLYAIFGSSRQLVVAVSSAVAITSAATITILAPQGTAEYAALTAALAILAGLISLAAGVLRLGRVAQFFSSSVLLGFVFGLALIITMKQIPKILGIDVSASTFFAGLWRIVTHLDETSVATLAVGVTCIVGMVVLERFVPKVPAALAVLIGSIVASAALDLSQRGVQVVGDLPSGLALPQLPGVGASSIPLLFTGAAGIALLAFAEAVGPAREFGDEHDYEIDANQELIALGTANMGAGLFQGFPIGASLSKSAANNRVGAQSPMSLIMAALATILVALFLTPLFRELPEAALAAIVIVAVSDMERIAPLRRLWRLRRADFALALVAMTGVLVFDILPGLAIAVVVSLGLVVWRASEARVKLLGRTAGRPEATDDTQPLGPVGLLLARPEQMLFFVNANQITDAVVTAIKSEPRPDVVLLDLSLSPELDVPATDALLGLRERVATFGVSLWILAGTDKVADQLRSSGVADAIGRDHLFDYLDGALLAYLAWRSSDSGETRRAVLEDVLHLIRDSRQSPGRHDDDRHSLDAIERHLLTALDDKEQADPLAGEE